MEIEYNQKIRPILDTFDEIGTILRNEEIDLPKIVVVGDQSSGKSSVLESITGISLPRGSGTVTKCPIIIQSRSVKAEEEERAEIQIDEIPDLNIKATLADFPNTLKELQDKLLSIKKEEITPTPITVRFFKRNIPDLTLYDLPGITYKKGLTDKIREIIKKFTKGPLTIILLILPANVDLTNTEAIELIQENEDFKDRSLAVVTKIDLGVNEKGIYRKIISNDLGLKYEPIIVRNRTQEELENNESIEMIRRKELNLIQSNEDLRKLPETSKGTQMLINFLIELQKDKLQTSKVKIKEQIREKIKEIDPLLESLPKPVDSFSEKIDRFKECLNNFERNFKSIIEHGDLCEEINPLALEAFSAYGENEANSSNILNQTQRNINTANSGNNNADNIEKNICYAIQHLFNKFNFKVNGLLSDFFHDNFYRQIKDLVEKSQGFNLQNFQNSSTMRKIFDKEIRKVDNPLRNLIEDVTEIVKDILNFLINNAFYEYPMLNMMINDELDLQMTQKKKDLLSSLNKLLEVERSFLWTSNSNYIYFYDQIRKINDDVNLKIREEKFDPYYEYDLMNYKIKIKSDSLFIKSNDERHESIKNVQMSCFSYWKVFESRFMEYARLFILNELLYFFRDNFAKIIDMRYSPSSGEQAQDWICEDKSISIKRKKLSESRENLKNALKKLNKVL